MKFLNVLALCCAVLVSAGCASTGRNFDESKLADIHKGQTTEPDLIALFGQPQNRSVNSEGVVTMTWVYAEAHVKGESFAPIVGAFIGGTHTKSKSLSVKLAEGKVTDYTYSGGGDESRNMTQSTPKN